MNAAALSLALGFLAGFRTLAAPTALCWAAGKNRLPLAGTPFRFLLHPVSRVVFSVLAVLELIRDKLPGTPSRWRPVGLACRLISGAFCGAAVGWGAGAAPGCAGLGAGGAWFGTVVGSRLRSLLAARFGRDWPAALAEDLVTVTIAAALISRV